MRSGDSGHEAKIPPALTAEDWRRVGPSGVGHPLMPSTLGDLDSLDQDDLAKAMAVANALLDERSPYKITRADVVFVKWVGNYGQNPGWMTEETADKLIALAAKLAALLPPDDPAPRRSGYIPIDG